MKRLTLPAISLLAPPLMLLAACDGPREQMGEKTDAASGAVESEDTLRSGPAEILGEQQDEAVDAAQDAREAQADALEDQAEAARETAEERAERLEQRADQVRGQ